MPAAGWGGSTRRVGGVGCLIRGPRRSDDDVVREQEGAGLRRP